MATKLLSNLLLLVQSSVEAVEAGDVKCNL